MESRKEITPVGRLVVRSTGNGLRLICDGHSVWTTIAFISTAAFFVGLTLATLQHQRWARRLPALEALPASADGRLPTSAVRCSVIVAARDEEARLEATVRHLLAQQHVALEVIVVDDRSTDATGDILRRLASEDTRVWATRVEHLPDGWLRKSHACHVGATLATGDWLLFTDADCWLKPDVIARALRVAARDTADHVTLTPGVAAETLGAQAWHLAFLGSLANWMSGVNRDRRAHTSALARSTWCALPPTAPAVATKPCV